jgi:hypothetical protein
MTRVMRGEMFTVLWLERLRESGYYEDLVVEGRTALVWMLPQ